MIRQRVRAGLKRAVEAGKQLGRPKIDPAMEKRIQAGRHHFPFNALHRAGPEP
jgi:DNA invertase Pin-like site-specific DNA recombinase